jgi:GNAT superfamily N-acetyltransferase
MTFRDTPEQQIIVRPFTEAMLDATNKVVMAAYSVSRSRKDSLRRHLALQPDGSFVALLDGTIVGFCAVMDYGRFAYVGLMSVHPGMQKRGIGGVLLEHCLSWLEKRHCPTILLDATPVGFPLYRRSGFVEEDQTAVLQQTHPVSWPRQLPGNVATLETGEFSELVLFDTAAFGTQRSALLAAYVADNPQRVLIVRGTDGHISGYLIAQASTLGPWVARTVGDAERLLLYALSLPFEHAPGVFVSARHHEALGLLERYGFTRQRSLSHMRKGEPVQQSRQKMLYGRTSLGLG